MRLEPFDSIVGAKFLVKWNMTKLPKDSKVLLCGSIVSAAVPPVSAPQSPSSIAADLPMADIPWNFSKQELILILNRMPVGFHSCRGESMNSIICVHSHFLSS